MEQRSAAAHFFDALLKTNAFLGGVAAILIGLFATHLVSGTVPTSLFTVTSIVLLFHVVVLIQALRAASRATLSTAPRVVAVARPRPPFSSCKCICTVESDAPVMINTSVMFYVLEDGIEHQLGVGMVRHQQADGRIQVTLDQVHEGTEKHVEALARRDQTAIEKLRVAFHIVHSAGFGSMSTAGPVSGPTVAPPSLASGSSSPTPPPALPPSGGGEQES